MTSAKTLRELFQEIGSEERLKKILERFYARMSKDVLLGFFFDGKDVLSIAHKQAEFLLKAMGQRKEYVGKAPQNAHTSLPPILAGHFDRRIVLLEETLSAEGLSPAGIASWVQFEKAYLSVIVQ